jgi:signal transduction histidine kinase
MTPTPARSDRGPPPAAAATAREAGGIATAWLAHAVLLLGAARRRGLGWGLPAALAAAAALAVTALALPGLHPHLAALAVLAASAAAIAVARRGDPGPGPAGGEERYRALVETSPDGLMVERDGVVLFANAGLARMLGAAPGDPGALVGRRVGDLLDPAPVAAAAGLGGGPAPASLRRADGALVPVEAASAEVSFGGRPALQVVLRDASGRRWAERAQAERALELEAANQELDRFASVVAHDLRAPLRHVGVLAGWVEEELGGTAPPGARERLRQIAERVARMAELIDGLRRYAQAGRRHDATAPVDLEGMVRATVDLLAPPAGFRFELDLRPRVVEAAEPPLATVLRNLIANAIRHHDRGGGLVRVAARPLPAAAGGEGRPAAAPGLVEFSVQDDGPGVPPRLHVLVLDAYRTFGPDLRPTGEGVGLALVRRIVAAHGGTVRIGPRPDGARGADVRFTWPAAEPAERPAGATLAA